MCPSNMYKKKIKKKKFDSKRKRTFVFLGFSSIAILKKKKNDNDFVCQLCFLSMYLFWLVPCIFYFLYLQIQVTIIN